MNLRDLVLFCIQKLAIALHILQLSSKYISIKLMGIKIDYRMIFLIKMVDILDVYHYDR